MKKKIGRPRKKKDVISFQHFSRAGIVMALYDEFRKNGSKHSVAVTETVEYIRKRYAQMRISATAVKRILAEHRPKKHDELVLRFERYELVGNDLMRFWEVQKRLAVLRPIEGKSPSRFDVNPHKPITIYKIRLGARPNYPRHNAKI